MKTLKDIPEINQIPKVDTFEDIIELNNFVFSVVPQSDTKISDAGVDLYIAYEAYKKAQVFGWCHANAVFFHLLLREYYRDSFICNFGFQDLKISHTTIVVTLGCTQYMVDPYFCKHYETKDGKVLTFQELISYIENKKMEEITAVYGDSLKPIHRNSGKIEYWSGKKLEESVLGGWNAARSYEKVMKKEFNNLNCLLLILKKIEYSRIVRKSNGALYWEFF